jgi:hypothetical protein
MEADHRFVIPQVREIAPPTQAAPEPRRPITQRDRVAASLLGCPDRSRPKLPRR